MYIMYLDFWKWVGMENIFVMFYDFFYYKYDGNFKIRYVECI